MKFLGKLARKEYVNHKSIVYQTFAGYLEREVPKVNEIIPRSDKDEASRKWYSITSLYNYKAFYNPTEKEIEKLINPTTGLLEEVASTSESASKCSKVATIVQSRG